MYVVFRTSLCMLSDMYVVYNELCAIPLKLYEKIYIYQYSIL